MDAQEKSIELQGSETPIIVVQPADQTEVVRCLSILLCLLVLILDLYIQMQIV